MQGLGMKKESHVFKRATAYKRILCISAYYKHSQKRQCQTNHTSEILVSHFLFYLI